MTLLNTGCPRSIIHETALQLLQILDKRLFGSETFGKLSALAYNTFKLNHKTTYARKTQTGPFYICKNVFMNVSGKDRERSTLDVLLSTTYSRSQLYLSRQLAQLHPELTMPMFSGNDRLLIEAVKTLRLL